MEVDERVRAPELVGDPHGQQHHTGGDDAERDRRAPSPVAPFAEHHGDSGDGQAEQHCAEHVEANCRRPGPPRQDDQGARQGACGHDGSEPVGGVDVEQLGDQRRERVPEAGADGSGHREGGDGPACSFPVEVAPGDGHVDRQQSEPESLEPSADNKDDERSGQGRHHAADEHDGEGDGDDVALSGPVGETTHDRRGQRTGQQRRGQHPLGCAERHVVGLGNRRDQRRAQAAHDGDEQTHEDQGGHEERGAAVRSHQLMTS